MTTIPTLLSWQDDFESWKNKYIVAGTRSREYDLMVESVGPDIYLFPLFTEAFCSEFIDILGTKGDDIWTKQRHEFYPTTDVPLVDLQLNDMYHHALCQFAHPLARKLWRLEGKRWDEDTTEENFVVRYRAEDQQHLSIHHDYAEYTLTVGLNSDFEGGGTWFPRQQVLANPKQGYCSLFPSVTHPHGGRPTTKGVRYIIVSFCRRPNLYCTG